MGEPGSSHSLDADPLRAAMHAIILALLISPSMASWREAECGMPAVQPSLEAGDRIINGQVAVPASWPWHVFIHVRGDDYCGGALVDDQHVITAAHCSVFDTALNMTIYLGSHQRTVKDDTEVHVGIQDICVHPGFTDMTRPGQAPDIAVIKLNQKVNFTHAIHPVCLPENNRKVTTGSELFVTGWGFTKSWRADPSHELHQLKLKAISSDDCKKMDDNVIPGVFCASHDDGSICGGDSGGPLVQKQGDRWTLQGLVSGGSYMCTDRMWPQFFTQVSSFVDNFIVPYLDHGICLRSAKKE